LVRKRPRLYRLRYRELQATRLSDIIQRNTNLTTLKDNVFFLPVAAPLLTGDYNHDGEVNVADYVVWRNGLGTTYMQSDYDIWRAHFGETASAGRAAASQKSTGVPEPAALLICVSGIVCLAVGRRGRCELVAQRLGTAVTLVVGLESAQAS
jgi:hypothetical protein